MDTDVLALKSSDDVIFSPATRSVVMPLQSPILCRCVINAVVMAKPHAPFLRRWMDKYESFDPKQWDRMTSQVPMEMYDAGEPDLTILNERTWLYPQSRSPARQDFWHPAQPMHSILWIGKSWHYIDENYGQHFHNFHKTSSREPPGIDIGPDVVRNIDTPLFCRIRKLFDNVDGDGVYSAPWSEDPNCTVSWVKDLQQDRHRLFADYRIKDDDLGMKMVDSSGHRNHGWVIGSDFSRNDSTGEIKRHFSREAYAFLPVPADWDSRVGTIRLTTQMDDEYVLSENDSVVLLKIRMDYVGEIIISLIPNVISLGPDDNTLSISENPLLKFEWHPNDFIKGDEYKKMEEVSWTSDVG